MWKLLLQLFSNLFSKNNFGKDRDYDLQVDFLFWLSCRHVKEPSKTLFELVPTPTLTHQTGNTHMSHCPSHLQCLLFNKTFMHPIRLYKNLPNVPVRTGRPLFGHPSGVSPQTYVSPYIFFFIFCRCNVSAQISGLPRHGLLTR